MSTSQHPTTSSASPNSPSTDSSGPDAAISPRNLSDGSLHYYSTEEDQPAAGEEPYKMVPIRQVVTSLQEFQETLGIGTEEIVIFPSRLGGPEDMPTASVNAYFPRSGPHRWFGTTETEKSHPLHGKVFSLYYGPHFRRPREGWTGNERIDWLRYLWDWRPAKEHQSTTFEAWVETPRAEEFWKRRLRDKACEYYVEYGTVQGTVLEEREIKSKEQWEGPTNQFEPDIYVLRNYLRRIELGQGNEGPYGGDEKHGDEEEKDEQDAAGDEDAQSSRSDDSCEATSSISSSVQAKMRARKLERQWRGIKAPPSSLREPTPDAPKIHERRQSRLQFLKSALVAAWSRGMSFDDGAEDDPSPSGESTPMPSTSGMNTPRPSTAGSSSQGPSLSGRGQLSSEFPGLSQGRRRQRQRDSAAPNWPFQ